MRYFVDCSWTTFGTIEVEAKSEDEARDIALDTPYEEFEISAEDNFSVDNITKEDE